MSFGFLESRGVNKKKKKIGASLGKQEQEQVGQVSVSFFFFRRNRSNNLELLLLFCCLLRLLPHNLDPIRTILFLLAGTKDLLNLRLSY